MTLGIISYSLLFLDETQSPLLEFVFTIVPFVPLSSILTIFGCYISWWSLISYSAYCQISPDKIKFYFITFIATKLLGSFNGLARYTYEVLPLPRTLSNSYSSFKIYVIWLLPMFFYFQKQTLFIDFFLIIKMVLLIL